MMFPPLVRFGPPPIMPKMGMVVLTKRGWTIAKWHSHYDHLLDMDRETPPDMRIIDPRDVRCWMPEDGS